MKGNDIHTDTSEMGGGVGVRSAVRQRPGDDTALYVGKLDTV